MSAEALAGQTIYMGPDGKPISGSPDFLCDDPPPDLLGDDPRPHSRKSPIKWPGGKWYMRKDIIPHLPRMREMVSPFLGGGHIELDMASRGVQVYASDIYLPLCAIWWCLKHDPKAFAERVREICGWEFPLTMEAATKAVLHWRSVEHDPNASHLELGAALFISTKLSYGGKIGNASASKPPLYTDDEREFAWNLGSYRRMRRFYAPNLHVQQRDYREALAQHPDTFAYLDPPYKIKSMLYGPKGTLHKAFDHERFANVMAARPGPWAVSYNDDPWVRDRFQGCRFVEIETTYRLGAREGEEIEKGTELLIFRDKGK